MRTMEEVRKMRILVVDDNHAVREAFHDFLQLLGHEVYAAEDGRQAIELFQHHRDAIDLLITDIRMPGIDGLELIRSIRQQDQALPIIVITGYANDDYLGNVTSLGIQVFRKPLDFEEFERHLRNH